MGKKISIIIVNGSPRAGKDTAIKQMRRYCDVNDCAILHHTSSIDPIKHALYELGWDGEKDDMSRDMLALLKQFWINKCDGGLKYCMDYIMKCYYDDKCNDDHVIVVQIREPSEIEKLINALEPIKLAYGLNVSTLFVDRPSLDGKVYNNPADAGVTNYSYDAKIINDGTKEDLQKAVFDYMDKLLNIYMEVE